MERPHEDGGFMVGKHVDIVFNAEADPHQRINIRRKKMRKAERNMIIVFCVLSVLSCLLFINRPASAQDVIAEWGSVKVPPPPELKDVTVDPKTTALLLLDFNKQTCNAERRPAA